MFIATPSLGYTPSNFLEWRFLNPTQTAVLNPLPAYPAFEADYLKKTGINVTMAAAQLWPNSLAPKGYVGVEYIGTENVFSTQASTFLTALQNAWSTIPINPYLPYNNITNPYLPVKFQHMGKEWGFDSNPKTTPYDGKLQPFTNPAIIASVNNHDLHPNH